jgi:hypothetical protein
MSGSQPDQDFINALRAIFGKRAILFGEDAARYDELLAMIAADVKPQTMREWLVVKDVVDAQWEYWRIRGFKAGVLHAALPRLIADEIAANGGGNLSPAQKQRLREQLLRVTNGEEGTRETFASLLAEYQLSIDSVAAVAFKNQMAVQVELDDRADAVRCRRNAAYDELDSLREKVSRRVVTPPLSVGTDQGVRRIDAPASIVPSHPADASDQHVEPDGSPAKPELQDAGARGAIGNPGGGERRGGS